MPCVCSPIPHTPRDGAAVPFFLAFSFVHKAPDRANRYTSRLSSLALGVARWVILPVFVFLGMLMRTWKLAAVVVVGLAVTGAAWSQERIYRCGNEYTNNPEQARLKNCRPLEGGNLTVVQGTRPAATGGGDTRVAEPRTPRPPSANAESAPRPVPVDSNTQRARESDARAILEAELRRAEDALAQARQAFAGGQPEKQGPEFRNHQMYLDRVAQLQAAVQRAEADVASIKRELSRLAPPGR